MPIPVFAPTPLYLLESDEAGNRIYIKREDLLPYCFGGNKARIGLRYVEDMRKMGCNHMLAYGNARSNLCRVLSNLCAQNGFRLSILTPADDDGQQRPSMNGQLCGWLGANIIPCLKTGVADSVDAAMESIRAAGDSPYYIYGDRTGQGNRAVPVAAYADQYAPLMAQCAEIGIAPDVIALATGTGMTQAGLLCGQALHGAEEKRPDIIGLSTARDEAAATLHLSAYIKAYLSALPDATDSESVIARIRLYDKCRGSYGARDEAIAALIRRQFAQHGLPLDMTYTGKAFYALEQLMAEEGWQNRTVVFIHTGGTPLFFDELRG